jgi:Flp pilus assembly pilin Flp
MWYVFWKIRSGLQSLTLREEGQDLVEYSLLLLMLAVALVATLGTLGKALAGYYSYIVAHFP